MGNAINFWEIQAEVWATGKYLTVNALNEDDLLSRQITAETLLASTSKLNDSAIDATNETCFSTAQATSTTTYDNLKQSVENLCIESA